MKQVVVLVVTLLSGGIWGEASGQTEARLKLSKTLFKQEGQYLQSFSGHSIPDDMVVQGVEIHYQVSLPKGSMLDKSTTTYAYSFKQKQGKVKFLGDKGSSSNYFKADFYGQNIIKVSATDATGKTVSITDEIFVDFASRRVLGGDAESLSMFTRNKIDAEINHHYFGSSKGMAYLPNDIARGDQASDEIRKGFFQTTEPRLLLTSIGTLIQTTQARRIGPNDAPPGQGIVVSRSMDHGNSWQNEMLLVQSKNDLWGYTALVEVDNIIYCYVVAGHPTHQTINLMERGIYYFTSSDDGQTWSEKIKHKGLTDALGFTASTTDGIPQGASPNCNILKVPGLKLDGVTAPDGKGLLLSTYARGYIWASVDGGINWSKVADHAAYADETKNGYGKPISLGNEIGWSVLDNDEGDIYAVLRRQAFEGYKNEYVFSKEMTSGDLGITFKGVYNQDLKNLKARRCHHGLRTIQSGPDKGILLFAYQGSGQRQHIKLALTKQPIVGNRTISADLYNEALVMENVAWGYCDVVYLPDDLANTGDMGKDAIVMIGESEPIDQKTYQIIDLKPDGKGKDERYTTTQYMLSMDYFKTLINQLWGE